MWIKYVVLTPLIFQYPINAVLFRSYYCFIIQYLELKTNVITLPTFFECCMQVSLRVFSAFTIINSFGKTLIVSVVYILQSTNIVDYYLKTLLS